MRRLPPAARPAVVSVSVNPWGDTPRELPRRCRPLESEPELALGVRQLSRARRVWKQYEIAVQVTKKVIAGVSVREISHTEAAYLIDPAGDERALLLYPFQAADVISALAKISSQ